MHSPPHGSAVNYRPTHISPAVNSTASFWISGGRASMADANPGPVHPPFQPQIKKSTQTAVYILMSYTFSLSKKKKNRTMISSSFHRKVSTDTPPPLNYAPLGATSLDDRLLPLTVHGSAPEWRSRWKRLLIQPSTCNYWREGFKCDRCFCLYYAFFSAYSFRRKWEFLDVLEWAPKTIQVLMGTSHWATYWESTGRLTTYKEAKRAHPMFMKAKPIRSKEQTLGEQYRISKTIVWVILALGLGDYPNLPKALPPPKGKCLSVTML